MSSAADNRGSGYRIVYLDPTIERMTAPWAALQYQARDVCLLAGEAGCGRDPGGEGVSGIDYPADAVLGKVIVKTGRAAEAANPDLTR
jgi:hypothetical protein